MRIFKEYYRELLEKLNFINNERVVYANPSFPSKAPGTQPQAPSAKPEPKAEKPFDEHDFERHEKEYNDKLAKLKKIDNTADTTKVEKEFKEQKDSYSARVELLKTNLKKDLAALKAKHPERYKGISKDYVPHVKSLIARLETRIKTAEAQQPKPEEKPKEATTPGTEKKDNPLKKPKSKKALERIKAVLKKKIPGHLKKLNEAAYNYIINKLTPERVKKLEKGGDFLTSKADYILLKEAYLVSNNAENLDEANDKEIKLIKTLKLNGKAFEFGADSKIPEMLSRQYKIEEVKGKPGQIKIDGKIVTDIKGLQAFLDTDMQKLFEEATGNETPDLKKLNDLANKKVDALNMMHMTSKAFDRLADLIPKDASPDKAPGAFESLLMLLQLFDAIKKAFDTKDWETLRDFMSDWTNLKTPKAVADSLKASKEAYKKTLDTKKPKDIGPLLKVYMKPREKEANELFGETGPGSKYRAEAKPAIQDYLAKNLNVSIESITELPNKRTQIIGYTQGAGGKKVAIEFYPNGDKLGAEIKEFKTVTEKDSAGKDTQVEKKNDKGEHVKGEVTFESLQTALTGVKAPEAPPQPATQPEKKEAPKYTKEDLQDLHWSQLKAMVIKAKEGGKKVDKDLINENYKKGGGGKRARQKRLDEARIKWIIDHNITKDQVSIEAKPAVKRSVNKLSQTVTNAVGKNAKLKETPEYKKIQELKKGPEWKNDRRSAQAKLDAARRDFIQKNTPNK